MSFNARAALRGAAVAGLAGAAVLTAMANQKPADPIALADQLAQDPVPLPQAVVSLKPGKDASHFASRFGLTLIRRMHSQPNGWVMAGRSAGEVAKTVRTIEAHPWVDWTFQDEQLKLRKQTAFAPDDPFYFFNNPTGYSGQWHLRNTENLGGQNVDVRAWPAWQRGVTGQGVVIGIIDDGVEVAHPDLAANISAADGFDFGQNDSNPSPVHSDDDHGTAVAGVAAARGGNTLGVTGAAPRGLIAGLRVDFINQQASQFVDAILYRSQGATRTIQIKNHSFGVSTPYIPSSQSAAIETSAAAGTIHVLSAGNDRGGLSQDTNTKDAQNQPGAITVAALGKNGVFSDYSNFGASVFITAPSSSSGQEPITTTDRMGSSGYNSGWWFSNGDYGFFGGTSSSAPLVAGVLALVKQAQPALDVRFAKHLLARYSNVIDSGDATPESDGGWRTNAAGFRFNQNYGFGMIDADRLTANAPLYTGVTPLSTTEISTQAVGATIPDASQAGITRTFSVSSTTALEEVEIGLTIAHSFRGDLEVFLTSPAGTTSRMVSTSQDSRDNLNDWRFLSNAFWGENPSGTWTIRVADRSAGDEGTWTSFSARLRQGTIFRSIGIASLGVAPASVRGGRTSTGTVTLNAPAPAGGVVVNLADDSPSASVPASVTVAAGATSASFTINTSPVTANVNATITASREGSTNRTAVLQITRPAPLALTLNPTSIRGGASSTATVTLDGPAPTGGLVLALRSNRAEATVPANATVPAGASSVTFTISSRAVGALVYPTIYATASSVTRFALLTVRPPILNGFTFSPATVLHGGTSTGTVTIDEAAPAGGVRVALRSTRTTVANCPAFVDIPAGSTSATFIATTSTVGFISSATLIATVGSVTRGAAITVLPPLLTAMTVSPASVTGGQNATVTVTIEAAAPAGGVRVDLRSNRSEAQVPASVTIPQGQTSATFTVTTSVVTARVFPQIYGTIAGRSRFVQLVVNP